MKSNQKGFTLIELLAVIVILAIIALIATPIVLNIIEKARKSAAADSVYGVMEAVRLAYTESLLNTTSISLPFEVTCSTTGDTSSCTYGDENDPQTLTLSGTVPSSGTITLGSDGTFNATTTPIVVNGIDCNISDNGNVTCD